MKRIIFVLSVLSALSSLSYARILNVPDDFDTIQAGIDAAEEGDTVLVQPGIYEENIDFIGKAIAVFGDFDDPSNVIIDGSERGSVVTFSHDEPEGAMLLGFTIRNGFNENGGGILCNGIARPVLKHLIVTSNRAEVCGGGICALDGSHPSLSSSIIEIDSACSGGGIYYSGDAALDLYSVTVCDNFASNMGGGIFGRTTSQMNISHVSIVNNYAGSIGGGYYHWQYEGVAPLMEFVTISGNNSEVLGGLCIEANGGEDFTNCIFWNNSQRDFYHHIQGRYIGPDAINISFSDFDDSEEEFYVQIDGALRLVTEQNLNSDPLFLDPDNGDYSLSPDSPCIDAGDPDSPLDPDGTRADMGAFYFHQRDIEVDRQEVIFPPLGWEEIDSQFVEFSNTGLTDLHLIELNPALMPSFIYHRQHWSPDEPVTIPPDSTFRWWIYFHPRREGEGQAAPMMSWEIITDDPDEDSIEIIASGEILAVPSDNFHSSLFALHSAFPNPFNSSTTITFTVGALREGPLRLAAYDVSGRLVTDLLADTRLSAGTHKVVWEAGDVPAGIYLIRLKNDSQTLFRKVVLTK